MPIPAAARRRLALVLAAGVVLVVAGTVLAGRLAGDSSEAAPATRADLVVQLPRALSAAELRRHLTALQRIADENGGTRAAATPGYDRSVRYVRETLEKLGYEPQVTPFPFVEYRELTERARQVSPRRRSIRIEAIDYSPSTPRTGLRAPVVAAGNGCSRGDFVGVQGRIALASRGICFIFEKAQNAAAAGAVALLVFNPEPGPIDATLGDPDASRIPVAAIDEAVAQSLLAREGSVVSLTVTTVKRPTRSQNVLADTHARGRVLLVGAHLDTVVASPGVNDNGTGVAAVLELARAVKRIAPRLAVRFAFWGGEEYGLIGSRAYARTVNRQQLAGYLNFDMLGSRRGTIGVYKGTFARRLEAYYASRGQPTEIVDMTGRADHFPFEQIGIPTGGLFAGGDSCYHTACDRLGRVDFELLADIAAGAAYGVAAFAPMR